MMEYIYIVGLIAVWTWLYSKYEWILFAIESITYADEKFRDMDESDVEMLAKVLIFLLSLFWPVTLFIAFMTLRGK